MKIAEEDSVEIAKMYEKNKEKLRGDFDTFSKPPSADIHLIGHARKIGAEILTDEIMPRKDGNTKAVKLNIPSLADHCRVKCHELKDSINILSG
ncbi:MAG: DUF4411 family protein [Candidatus Kaiserbacteria bacterium]|nr:DUF4411 family protein [Candidatus Kaiserbacteria bacterium]